MLRWLLVFSWIKMGFDFREGNLECENLKFYNMEKVIDLIDKRIEAAKLSKSLCRFTNNRLIHEAVINSLNELKSEILNEAVVCGSEKSFTWCKECESHRLCNMIEKCKDK